MSDSKLNDLQNASVSDKAEKDDGRAQIQAQVDESFLAGARVAMEDSRRAVLQEAWNKINSYIKPGRLQGNGCDDTAQRNGMILASNIIMEMLRE